jgi:hypothetical protein
MDVLGCHVIAVPSDKTTDGFETTVQKDGIVKGPFPTIKEAIECAMAWTASTNQPIYVDPPHENPPVMTVPDDEPDRAGLDPHST